MPHCRFALTLPLLLLWTLTWPIPHATRAAPPGEPTSPTQPRLAFAPLQAEEADAMQGVEVYGDGVGFVDEGDWLRYDQIDLGSGVTDFFVRIAVPDESAGRQIEVHLDAPDGQPVGVLTVAASGSWNDFTIQQVAIDPIGGVHDLYIRFAGGSGVGNIDWFRFAPVAAPGPAEPIPAALFGMHIHRAATDATWPTVPFAGWRLHDANGLFWHQLEPAQDAWDFTLFDQAVALAEENGVELLYVLGQTPAWAAARPDAASAYDRPGTSSEPANLADWRDYVRTVAARYRGRIRYYEIWNEPDLPEFYSGDVETMVALTQEAHAILREVDPAAQIVAPSTVPNYGTDWLDTYLALGAGAYVDVIGAHLYLDSASPPEEMPALIDAVRRILITHGQADKPLWNTESNFGYVADDTLITGDDALAYVARAYLVQWHAGAARHYWYAWDNQNFVGLRLTESDGTTPTAAASAYATVQRWLVGTTLQSCAIDVRLTWRCTLVDGAGQPAQIVWHPKQVERYPLPASATSIHTLSGETVPISGQSEFEVSPLPVYLALGDSDGPGESDGPGGRIYLPLTLQP